MNEQELATLVNRVMESILAGGAMLDNLHDAQIVIRPIFTWPETQMAGWPSVNCPN